MTTYEINKIILIVLGIIAFSFTLFSYSVWAIIFYTMIRDIQKLTVDNKYVNNFWQSVISIISAIFWPITILLFIFFGICYSLLYGDKK